MRTSSVTHSHAFGGQDRLEVFRRMLSERGYQKVAEWRQRDVVPEQVLVRNGILRGPGTYTPGHCAVFRRLSG
jgi:hypothetical protein